VKINLPNFPSRIFCKEEKQVENFFLKKPPERRFKNLFSKKSVVLNKKSFDFSSNPLFSTQKKTGFHSTLD